MYIVDTYTHHVIFMSIVRVLTKIDFAYKRKVTYNKITRSIGISYVRMGNI